MSKPIAVVLHSGGLDSTTCLAVAQEDGYEPHALAFNYDQRHSSELIAATEICRQQNIQQTIMSIPIAQIGGSALTDKSIDVPDYTGSKEIPVTYVPARNLTFLCCAVGLAEVLQASAIYFGASSVDYSGYPDCRPEFMEAFEETANLIPRYPDLRPEFLKSFEKVANLATKAAVEGHPLAIKTPLMHLSKAETIQLGIKLGVDYSQTVSCYQADNDGRACGRCDSCVLRKKGFSNAGIEDPTRYR